jgi:uncharacterized protein (TIGR02246 family)
MGLELRLLVDQCLAAVEAKDLDAVLELFADDASMLDPHYPSPHMAGKPAIAEGMKWVFGTMDRLSFTVLNYYPAEDGQSAALEVTTAHQLRGGGVIRAAQTFVVVSEAGRITRFQAYTPYGPGGIGGLLLSLIRLRQRLRRG